MEQIIKKLKTMFEMQENLNIHTNGNEYRQTHICAKTGKQINYRRCAWMETAEFIDSFDWKHWKHGKDDIENAKTELVDIWHFLMGAELIENGIPSDLRLEIPAWILSKATIDARSSFVVAEAFVSSIIDGNKPIFPTSGEFDPQSPFCIFLELCNSINLSFNELYQRYIIKNTLNVFRQDNGYAEGTYIKMWEMQSEDNVFAVEFATKLNDGLSKDRLYDVLKYYYEHAVKNSRRTFEHAVFDALIRADEKSES